MVHAELEVLPVFALYVPVGQFIHEVWADWSFNMNINICVEINACRIQQMMVIARLVSEVLKFSFGIYLNRSAEY